MRILPAGDAAVLVELADLDEVGRLVRRAAGERRCRGAGRGAGDPDRAGHPGPGRDQPGAGRGRAARHDPAAGRAAGTGRLVELPTRYDGPDLADVAALAGLTPDEVARRHRASEWTVAFCGFAPGFALPDRRGPGAAGAPPPDAADRGAGRIGRAGRRVHRGYPRRIPGGWQLIGRTDAVLWDLDRDPPALLPPGTRVRFVPA